MSMTFIKQNLRRLLLCTPAALLLSAAAPPALALNDGPYALEVLVDGRPLDEYAARGTTYVEARRGREYSLRLVNRTADRIAVALSVDGLNTIDARRTSARDASKWVLGPYETVVIAGWQTDGRTARQFFFTSEERSYGAWLGRTANLGVISAAVFRERPRPVPVPYSEGRSRTDRNAPAAAPAPQGNALEKGQASGAGVQDMAPRKSESELAATGSGRVVGHEVERVAIDIESRPSAKFELRYEYHEALVRLGVLPRDPDTGALARRETARGFENGFCPDPGR